MDVRFTTLVTETVPLLARATSSHTTAAFATAHPTAVPNHAAPQKPSLFKRIILPIIIILILLIILAVAVVVFLKWRKRQQQTTTETKETYPPPEQQYNQDSDPNTPHEVQNGEGYEMQNQPHQGGEAAGYYNDAGANHTQTWEPTPGVNINYRQEGQQQPQEGQQDNKKKAIELAKKGWAMYKEQKNKPAA